MFTKELPDEYLTEMGRITVRWGVLEQVLNLALIALLGRSVGDGRPHAVFAHINFPQKLQMLSAFVQELKNIPPELLDYKGILKSLDHAKQERNKVSHWVWDVEDNGNVIGTNITARGALKFEIKVISLEDLRGITLSINLAIAKLGVAVFPLEEMFRTEDNMKKLL